MPNLQSVELHSSVAVSWAFAVVLAAIDFVKRLVGRLVIVSEPVCYQLACTFILSDQIRLSIGIKGPFDRIRRSSGSFFSNSADFLKVFFIFRTNCVLWLYFCENAAEYQLFPAYSLLQESSQSHESYFSRNSCLCSKTSVRKCTVCKKYDLLSACVDKSVSNRQFLEISLLLDSVTNFRTTNFQVIQVLIS